MKQNNSLVTIEKNRDTTVNVNVNVIDELSCDNIRKNYNEVVMLEEEFTDRLEYSKDVLTKKLLPKQLQSDFNIVPKLINGKMEYETKAVTPDAYEKFPIKMNYTMQFKDVEEAKKFRENGIEELQRQANLLQQPVEIPNITNMKEFLGEFENPVAHSAKYGSEGIKLFICPRPLPPAQKYSIEIFNDKVSFKLTTLLRLSNYYENDVILTNKESIEEAFDITIRLSNYRKVEEDEQVQGKFNITIALREKYYNSCEFNKEIIKYKFLVEDSNNHILIDNVDNNINIFSFENCGKTNYKKKDYRRLNNTIDLIDKVIYISKLKNIKVDYDMEHFIENEEFINLVYNELNNKNYTIKKSMTWSLELNEKADINELYKNDGKILLKSTLDNISLFGVNITLKTNEMIMYNCSVKEIIDKGKNKKVKFESSYIEFILTNNK